MAGQAGDTVYGIYTHIEAHAQVTQEDFSFHCRRIWILQNHVLPGAQIYSKNAEQGRPFTAVVLLCFGNTICWMLAGSLASPDKHKAAGAAQSSISNTSDLQLILWGWFQGKGGKGQPQCQTPNQLTRFQLEIFFIWVKFWIHKFRSTLWRLYCHWIIR